MAKDLPINPRIIEQMSKATIKNLIDGIVELVTNSDDSYKRIEQRGQTVEGKIEIYIDRKKGGICEKLIVRDYAEGMDSKELEKSIEFASETSGFIKGKTVRGLFGRGLKETIIALGKGEIKSFKNGKCYRTRLWVDQRTKRPQYDDEMLKESLDTTNKNGTEIIIDIDNEKIKVAEFENFKFQLCNHYALREINSSINREIHLTFEDKKRRSKNTAKISFKYPEGKPVKKEEINLSGYGDKLSLIVYEANLPLESPRNNPFGLAGILIKTNGAILENTLFKFDSEPAAYYFFGEAVCPGLEDRLRRGETELIDPNRGGVEWRHEYNQSILYAIESRLEPLVSQKRKQLEKKPDKKVSEETSRMLKKLCSLLNQIAREELEDLEPMPEAQPDVRELTIIPQIANTQIEKPRVLLVQAPNSVVDTEGKDILIKSDNQDVIPLATHASLEKSKKYPDLFWSRYFKVVGKREGACATITVFLGSRSVNAKVTVAPPKEIVRMEPRSSGIIKDILPDPNGINTGLNQRASFKAGTIWINVNFPSVSKFIRNGLEGVDKPEGKILLAELVGEAFCKKVASDGIEKNKYPMIPGSEIESFNTAFNDLQKKYLHKIQEIIFSWKF